MHPVFAIQVNNFVEAEVTLFGEFEFAQPRHCTKGISNVTAIHPNKERALMPTHHRAYKRLSADGTTTRLI
jgi:hypothetical protein